MPDYTTGSVPFSRALEILEIGTDELERLLDDGAIRAYRRGGDILFMREDLAAFITRRSDGPAIPSGVTARVPPPPAPAAPIPAQMSPRRPTSRRDTIKKAAMGAQADGDMVSLKKRAMEEGLVPQQDIPAPMAPPVGQPDAASEIMAAENESLRARLKAAEEVLNDLQQRCENASQFQSQNTMLVDELQQMRVVQAELEAKVVAYEEMDTGGAEGPRWGGGPDPEQEIIALKRQVAEMRGDLAASKQRLDDKEKDYGKIRMERDELNSKLSASATPGVDIARLKELEAEIVTLKKERDTLAVEAEVAQELKGEIERASELEEKLQTQREVIEAAQKGLAELEAERNEMAQKAQQLEQQLANTQSSDEQLGEMMTRINELESQLAETNLKTAQTDARATSLREERDKLLDDLEKRSIEIAELKVKADRAAEDVEGFDKVKAEADEAKSKALTSEAEAHSLQVQISLKDQLLEQFKTEGKNQSELQSMNQRLQERALEAETHSKQTDARLEAMRAERDSVSAELAKRDGAMNELRTQSERAGTLIVENKTMKGDLDTAQERIAELESKLVAGKAQREVVEKELEEANTKGKALEEKLQAQERDLGSIQKKVDAGGDTDEASQLRNELEALRGEISQQVKELGEMRAQGEQAATKRRSALEVAARRRVPTARKQAGPGGAKKPAKLGRFEIGDESRRTRTGTFYHAKMGGSGQQAEVLILPVDLTRDRYFLDRFWREMRIVVELEQKGLLDVLDVGEAGGVHYVAYQHVDGKTLETLLRESETLPVQRAVDIASILLESLSAAEKNKLVHGDLKPENIIVGDDESIHLSGLGLSRGTDEDASSLNERGRVIHYAAPEQILGEDRDARSDVWSVGALLMRMVSGKMPLEAGSLGEVRGLVQAGELPRAKDIMEIPDGLRECLEKMLSEKPEERYQDSGEALKALKKVKL